MLIQAKNDHIRDADEAYAMQRFDKQLAANDKTIEATWMDMMAVIQIPKLSTNMSFYKRKLRLHAEDFYRSSSKSHHIAVWSEIHGKKGSNNVISVLHKMLENIPKIVRHLILWMDNTSSQNKCSTLLKYLLYICTPESLLYKFQRVSLRFAPVGHTYMPCDRCFGRISQKLIKKKSICDPLEVVNIINNEVTNVFASYLSRPEHYDWSSFLDQFYKSDRKFLYDSNDEPTLMGTRQISFGYTEIYDERTGQTLLLQNKSNEIRSKTIFDRYKIWSSYIIQSKTISRPKAFTKYVASEHDLVLPNKKIQDLRTLKKYVPSKCKHLSFYNLSEHDDTSDESDT